MKKNIYWSVYKNLEKEVNILADTIHFDEDQLLVYSIKISELIIRCNVEIESIAKDLYFENGGTVPEEGDLYYDTHCLALLENNWKLSHKTVNVASANFYFTEDENKILKPLYKAERRGISGADWKKAYQAIKHNRSENLKKGNLKHLIRSMAALYLLNIYYRDLNFDFDKDSTASTFNPNLSSNIFSVKLHSSTRIVLGSDYVKNEDFDECVYLLRPTDETKQIVQDIISAVNTESNQKFEERVAGDVLKEFEGQTFNKGDDMVAKYTEAAKSVKSKIMIETAKAKAVPLKKAFDQVKYVGELNKQQY